MRRRCALQGQRLASHAVGLSGEAELHQALRQVGTHRNANAVLSEGDCCVKTLTSLCTCGA